ncbi:GH116 family glycosyl hydrolase [Fimbriimonas ginsengisoli]|uniref:Sucrose-6-phosphate hydrolase n=1 Tax=Fimbriimonas ginsengisoli Gsoil 348 TaxID=661478 RepID=A0A068NS07_FIMGI|nr:GH116 family glycosyl hydrolase [Fimbriimonas ginsengisoli]AIE84399.1 Sucrose-6-phosphate hydrolase [Fimbriimonas ginsengisoli Gsoil 348]
MEDLSRRSMLKMAGGTALGLGFPGKILAVLADGTLVVQDHKVPAEKGLSREWRAQLIQRGSKETWTGADLDSIGMPIGGIAAGQLYLCGDGTLGCWEIFNEHRYQNEGPYSYAKRPIPKNVEFGFTLEAGGRKYRLDKSSFSQIEFNGQYPIATVSYRDPACPVMAEMVAFSPFIPLNANDSGLPATVFEITVHNPGSSDVAIDLAGFLENACARSGEHEDKGRRRHTAAHVAKGLTLMVHGADPAHDTFASERANPRPNILIADFEGETYGNWKTTGTAFGPGPAAGTLPSQNPVTKFGGKRLVNSFYGGDDTKGRLTSPEFTVERDFITFKIGGGHMPGKTCINLLVNGKVVRTATGLNSEELLWDAWDVTEFEGKRAQIEIVDDATGGWGHINIDDLSQADRIKDAKEVASRHADPNRDNGTLALAALANGKASHQDSYDFATKYVGEVRPAPFHLAPGASHTVTFVLAWHFPHHPRGRNYANHFADAGEVATYVARNQKRLSADTKLWRDTYYDSTLPYWLLDRLHSTIGNIATGVTEWWKSGRFWAWEGVVCCSGTCTHVWNYEHSMARLFPELERNVRERQDFGEAFEESTGLVGFRSDREYAADGQCGTILKAYREHLNSADDRFLKKNWARTKKALEYLIKHDANGDGMIEDAQPNTYDIDFFGANTFVGSLYLAALRAGEEMAKELGDRPFAEQCRKIYESGREATMRRLWNGEYFIQEVDQSKYKQYQYGPGCLADQLFGQGWAHQVGLGHIYPADKVVKGLQSVWKYNWAPDVAGQNKRWPPQRPFALPGKGGSSPAPGRSAVASKIRCCTGTRCGPASSTR